MEDKELINYVRFCDFPCKKLWKRHNWAEKFHLVCLWIMFQD